MYALLLHAAVLMDNKLVVLVAFIPCRCDGGREHGRAAGKDELRAVFALIVAVDDRDGVSVLFFQRFERCVIRHIFHGHALSVREGRETLGVDGGIDRIRFGGDLIRLHLQIVEAPEEVANTARSAVEELEARLIRADHVGVGRAAGRDHADQIRQNGLDGAFVFAYRQPHKGIGPGVPIRIGLVDDARAQFLPLLDAYISDHIHRRACDHGAFSRRFPRFPIVVGAAQLDGGAVRGVCMSHAGKAVEDIAPLAGDIRAEFKVAVKLNGVNRCQHAPCAFCALRVLHKLVVSDSRSGDRFPGQHDR